MLSDAPSAVQSNSGKLNLGRNLRNVVSVGYTLLPYPTSFVLLAHADFPLLAVPTLQNVSVQ